MFELDTLTKAKLLDVVVLSQKNRQPDENPGAKLSFEMDMSNHALTMFDGYLKGFLFEKREGESPEGQASLDGVEAVSDLPHLTGIGAKIGSLHWTHDLTGYILTIDMGLGGASNLEIGGCKLSGWQIHPKEGGTVQIKFNAESSDVSEGAFGKLAKLKSCDTSILLAPPEIDPQETIEGDEPPGKSRRRRGRHG